MRKHPTSNIEHPTPNGAAKLHIIGCSMLDVGRWMFSGFAFLFLCCSTFAAVDISKLPPPASKQIDFTADIEPIFENSCIRCHGAEKPKSKFSLISREAALKGGANGVAIIPGDSAKSPLIHYVARLVEDMEMPPADKGDPLTAEQIGVLRAWIDQGAPWKTTSAITSRQPEISVAPSLGWIDVNGDTRKFREHFWRDDGFKAGLEKFSLKQRIDGQSSISAIGHAFPMDEDFRIELSYDRADVGFIRGGFKQFRKYYDDSGGYHPLFAPPIFSLDRDLHLDHGRAWFEIGRDLPDMPRFTLGYEYQYRKGAKSTLQWGAVRSSSAPFLTPDIEKNIYPAAKDIDEKVHLVRLDASHDFSGLTVSDNFRGEFYDLATHRQNALSFTPGQAAPTRSVTIDETHDQFSLANALKLEKEIYEWWLLSGGYLYSRTDADASFRQNTMHVTGLPISGDYWNSQAIILKQDAHVLNANMRLGPANDFTFFAGAQAQLTHQEGFGRVSFDTGNPAVALLVQPATLDANMDKLSIQENTGIRFTGVPNTTIFAEARLEQEDIGQFEQQAGGHHDFLRDTDVSADTKDIRTGFHTSPLRNVNFGAHYRHKYKTTDYNDRVDDSSGYPAFFRFRSVDTDELEAKLTLRPLRWLKTSLSYQKAATDFDSTTDATSSSPGGSISAANVDADVYGLQLVLTPFARWYLSSSLHYYDTRMETAHNDVPSVVPYNGDIYSVLTSVTYILDDATDLNASHSFSTAGYGQNNFAEGLPVGIDYDLHSMQAGVTRRFKRFTANLAYGFFDYTEPSSGGFNNYTAHAVFATMMFKWR